MGSLGTQEILVILVVALLVLGPQRLPELARGIGKFVREFRRQTDEVRTVVEREFYRMDQDVSTFDPNNPTDNHTALPGEVTTITEAHEIRESFENQEALPPGAPPVTLLPKSDFDVNAEHHSTSATPSSTSSMSSTSDTEETVISEVGEAKGKAS